MALCGGRREGGSGDGLYSSIVLAAFPPSFHHLIVLSISHYLLISKEQFTATYQTVASHHLPGLQHILLHICVPTLRSPLHCTLPGARCGCLPPGSTGALQAYHLPTFPDFWQTRRDQRAHTCAAGGTTLRGFSLPTFAGVSRIYFAWWVLHVASYKTVHVVYYATH